MSDFSLRLLPGAIRAIILAMPEDTTTSPPSGKPRRMRRWLMGCGCLLAGIMLLVALAIGAAIWLLSLFFSREPMDTLPEPDNPVALASAVQKIQTAAMAGLLDSGVITNDTPAVKPTSRKPLLLELNQAEVNAILHYALGFRQGLAIAETGSADERIDCSFHQGEFTLRFSKKLPDTPFGNWLNLTASFIPKIENQHLFINMTSCRVGRLSIPLKSIQKRLSSKNIPEFEQSPEGRQILLLIDKLEVQPDGIAVHFRSQAVTDALSQAAGTNISSLFDLLGTGGRTP
jgi:hypothetical protein